jgi:hypothetical protein
MPKYLWHVTPTIDGARGLLGKKTPGGGRRNPTCIHCSTRSIAFLVNLILIVAFREPPHHRTAQARSGSVLFRRGQACAEREVGDGWGHFARRYGLALGRSTVVIGVEHRIQVTSPNIRLRSHGSLRELDGWASGVHAGPLDVRSVERTNIARSSRATT